MPNKSLVLIEEPETSLHPAAQFEWVPYMIVKARIALYDYIFQ